MSADQDGEKPHDPSQKRLEDARKRGEIVKSADLTGAAAYGGLLVLGLGGAAVLVQGMGQVAASFLENADRMSGQFLTAGSGLAAAILQRIGLLLLPWLAAPALAVLLVLMMQGALRFSPQKLVPKWSRLSPLASAAQRFGRDGLFEFGKSLAKLLLLGAMLVTFLCNSTDELLGSLSREPVQTTTSMFSLVQGFLWRVAAMTLAFGALDYLWQRSRHIARNRMSRQELTDEAKESDGDPQVKMQRRQRGQEIASNRMLQDVAKADVVVVNPTHYAVALKWNRAKGGAPVCVAKGIDELAARIREKAIEAGVPLHSDPPTARALHASVEIGQQIHPDHYRAVAAAIRFAEAIRRRKRQLSS